MKHRTYGRPLSPREAELMPLILRGLPIKSLARELGIAEATVKRHLGHIFHKTGCATRLELIARGAPQPPRSRRQKAIEAEQASLRG